LETTLTTYRVGSEVEIVAARSEAGTVIEERRTQEVFTVPSPPPQQPVEIVKETKFVEATRSPSPPRHHHHNPIIIEGGRPREESTLVERHRDIHESSDPIPVGPLALALPHERHHTRDERAIRAEIRALEAEKESLRAHRRHHSRHSRSGRASESDLVLYERDIYERPGEEVTLVRREKISEPEGGVRIEKDRKGRMTISVPKYL
jgi:hypothetical protein